MSAAVMDTVCSNCGNGDGRQVLLCDGSSRDGIPCPAKVCFECANVLRAPDGDWFCSACSGKRPGPLISTPSLGKSSRISVDSPDLRQKVLAAAQRKLPPFPGANTPGMDSQSTPGDGVSNALVLITNKLEEIDTKLGSVVTIEGLQASLTATKADLIREFQSSI